MLVRSAIVLLFLLCVQLTAQAQTLSGYTQRLHDPQHGTQIEYLTSGGKSFLWYPGNSIILEGRWKREGDQICFAYGANTYNPATGQQGGGWECMAFNLYWWFVDERMQGDVFSLQTRQDAPFRLDPKRTTLEKLLARVSPGVQAPPVETTINDPGGGTRSLSCESILANAELSKAHMAEAVSFIFHGRFNGKPCGEPDVYRAYDLAQRAGISFEPWAKILRERAAAGNPRAISAVERLGL